MIWKPDLDAGEPDAIILVLDSEVCIAVQAAQDLTAEGIRARVVSMPCHE